MARIEPLERKELAHYQSFFEGIENFMGFVPNSMMTMAKWPEFFNAFGQLAQAFSSGKLPYDLRMLIGFVSSNASGCRYCQAHTAAVAERAGVATQKIQAAFEFETSPLFTDAERAALRVAAYASITPNAVEDHHFDELKKYYSDREIVEIVGHVSLYGLLNRWNDTMATSLEAMPTESAERQIADKGWEIGKHATDLR